MPATRSSVIHTRHEQGAAYMALGAALATGKPQVFSVVPGPGLLNATAALATAHSTSAPVLALSGQIPSKFIGKGHGMLHEIPDQIGILKTLTKWAARIEKPQDAPALVAQAFQYMTSGRPRPVGLEIAPDILQARADIDPAAPLPPLAQALDEDAIERAAKLLEKAERPLIFVGGGALDAAQEVQGAGRTARRAGRHLSARQGRDGRPPPARAGADRRPRAVGDGRRGARGRHAAAMAERESGASTTSSTIIKVDADPEEIDRIATPEIGLVGDAATRAGAAQRASAPSAAGSVRTASRRAAP